MPIIDQENRAACRTRDDDIHIFEQETNQTDSISKAKADENSYDILSYQELSEQILKDGINKDFNEKSILNIEFSFRIDQTNKKILYLKFKNLFMYLQLNNKTLPELDTIRFAFPILNNMSIDGVYEDKCAILKTFMPIKVKHLFLNRLFCDISTFKYFRRVSHDIRVPLYDLQYLEYIITNSTNAEIINLFYNYTSITDPESIIKEYNFNTNHSYKVKTICRLPFNVLLKNGVHYYPKNNSGIPNFLKAISNSSLQKSLEGINFKSYDENNKEYKNMSQTIEYREVNDLLKEYNLTHIKISKNNCAF